ncbi:MAG: hypothetical protein ACREPN_00090 [Rudaea sp.]
MQDTAACVAIRNVLYSRSRQCLNLQGLRGDPHHSPMGGTLMKVRYFCSTLASTLALFLLFTASTMTAGAAGKSEAKATPGTIADTWIMWPKAGEEKQFEAAVKQHAAWRKTAGEGFVWSIYQPIVGNDLAYYVIRTGDHHWKDFDKQAAWEAKTKAEDVYQANVGIHVAKTEHYFSDSDSKHSHWVDSKDYQFFSVTSFYTKSGTYGDRLDAMNKIQKAVIDEKWPYPYEFSYAIGGKEPLQLVIPMKNYADMADPDPSIMKILAKSLGSDAAAAATMKQFGGTIDHSSTTIYIYRPDLSTPK